MKLALNKWHRYRHALFIKKRRIVKIRKINIYMAYAVRILFRAQYFIEEADEIAAIDRLLASTF